MQLTNVDAAHATTGDLALNIETNTPNLRHQRTPTVKTSPAAQLHPDPIARAVAQELHSTLKPLATILFGSRARGDHQEETSDIDIMVIHDETTSQRQLQAASQTLANIARDRYQRDMETQLVPIPQEDLRENEHFINSLETRALLQGVIFSDHPEEFRSRYDTPNPPPRIYQWDAYTATLRSSLMGLKAAKTQRAISLGIEGEPQHTTLDYNWSILIQQEDPDLKRTSYFLRNAMNAAIQAAILATGDVPKMLASATTNMGQLRRLLPPEDTATQAPIEAYDQREPPEGMTPRAFTDLALADIEKTRKLAMRLRRRTKADADQANPPSGQHQTNLPEDISPPTSLNPRQQPREDPSQTAPLRRKPNTETQRQHPGSQPNSNAPAQPGPGSESSGHEPNHKGDGGLPKRLFQHPTHQEDQQPQKDLRDMTLHELHQALMKCLDGGRGRINSKRLDLISKYVQTAEILLKALGLCIRCNTRYRANQWAKYCHAPCTPDRQPPKSPSPPRLEAPPTIRQMLAMAAPSSPTQD